MEGALEPISCVPVQRTLRRQLTTGQGPYPEAWLWTARLERRSTPGGLGIGWSGPSADRGMRRPAPTALAALGTPALPLGQGPGALCWLTCLLPLFYGHGPVAVLGRWGGGHKTTILRGVVGLALAWWPRVAPWIIERVKAQRV